MSGLIGKLSALVTATVDKTNELLQARFENNTKPDKNSTPLSERDSEWTDVPQEVLELTDLESLDLSGNALTALPTDVIDTLNLETLNISGNKIIPTMITGNPGTAHYLTALFEKIESDNYLGP